jgi:hypothetical protein
MISVRHLVKHYSDLRRGHFVALGIVLLSAAFGLNVIFHYFQGKARI